jgi:orotate phosphoribosyltransferase
MMRGIPEELASSSGYQPGRGKKDNLVLADIGVKWVIGSAMGAVCIAYEIAGQHGCLAGFTEPVKGDSGKQMVLKRFNVEPGDRVFVVEDVMTTGGTTLKTVKALKEAGAEILPIFAVLVNRSGKKNLDFIDIAALIDRAMPMWEPDDCPLCKKGSEPIRPKGNWDRLTAKY